MNNRVAEILGIEKPILQGPMSWITNAEFVAAVSNAGGLGILALMPAKLQLQPPRRKPRNVCAVRSGRQRN